MNKLAIVVFGLGVIGSGACGKKGGGGEAGTGLAIDPAAVNSLVPAPLKDKLVFEKREIVIERGRDKTTYTLAAPKGWTQGMKGFGSLDAPKDSDLGFFTKFAVGSNCDGKCEKKDWEKISDKVNFEPLAKGKVLKDVKGKGNRLMVAEGDAGMNTTNIVFAWWTEGADSYRTCTATLDESVKDAAP
ncbi:MAG: hypothetical protein H0T42_21180, partial [Deltaproteobacteria bacterium]|nr:hypothetical protein [Deltaproteobacteria bacterium]